MLAGELLHRGEPPLHLLLARAVELEGFAIALELARRFANLHGRLFQ